MTNSMSFRTVIDDKAINYFCLSHIIQSQFLFNVFYNIFILIFFCTYNRVLHIWNILQ